MKRIRLLLKKTLSVLVLFASLFSFSGLVEAQLSAVTSSGLPNIGRGQIKFADFNNDGKLDALIIGQTAAYATSGCTIGLFLGNGDGTFTDATSTWLPSATAVNSGNLALADFDKDGDIDFCYSGRTTAGSNVVYLFRNNGSSFSDYTSTAFAGTTAPTGCYFGSIQWGDIDNDGDLDLMIEGRTYTSLSYPTSSGNRGNVLQIYRNNNNGTFTSHYSSTGIGVCYGQALFIDLEKDGDLDIYYSGGGNIGGYMLNDGTGTYGSATSNNTTRGSNMVIADFNKDGKSDMLQSYTNTSGTPGPAFRWLSNTSSGTTIALGANSLAATYGVGGTSGNTNMGMVSCMDYDNDGDMDFTIQGLASATTPTMALFLNDGSTAPTNPTFTDATLGLTGLHYGGAEWADLNNDGTTDLIAFGYSDQAANTAATKVYLNSIATTNTAPQSPTTINASTAGAVANLSWTMPSSGDDHTPNSGLTYNVRIGTSTGSSDIMKSTVYGPGKYNLTSASVKGLADGTYYWSVQSVDAQYLCSNWATEGTFTVGSPTNTPTIQASNVTVSSATQTSFRINWTNGDGYRTVVFMKEGGDVNDLASPSSNTVYTPNTSYHQGSQIGSTGWYCVYSNSVTPLTTGYVDVTGMTGLRTFQVMVVSFNASADNSIVNYLSTAGTNNPALLATIDYVAPSTVVNGLSASTITSTTASITPGQSAFTNYATVVFIKQGSNASEDVSLVSNTTYAANAAFGTLGTQVGTSGWYCVLNGNSSYKGAGAFYPYTTFTGLTPNTSYQVRACTYNGVAGLEKFSATYSLVFTTNASTASTFNTEGNWSNASNWSAGIPGSATNVTIASNCTKDGDLTIEPAVKYTINSGASLTVNGNLAINSSTVEPGTLVDLNPAGGLTVTGTSTVQQYLVGSGDATPNGRFWYFSSPVTGANSGAVSASGNNKLWSYSEASNSYTEITDDVTILTIGKGYVARLGANTYASFIGTPNTGDKSIEITRTGTTNTYRGFNLIGNPYPSFARIKASDNTTIESSLWFRTKEAATSTMVFDTYNIASGDSVSGSGNPISGFIPPMQAFWVKTMTAGTSNVVFKQAYRFHNDPITAGIKLRGATVDSTACIRIRLTNGKTKDETLVKLYPNASDAFDRYDSRKMTNSIDSFPEIFTMNGSDELAINGMRHDGRTKALALGFRTGRKGNFKFKVIERKNLGDSLKVILKDKLKNIEKELLDSTEYDFTSDIATTTDRFSIVITANAPTALKNISTTSAEAFGTSDKQIQVRLIGTADNKALVTVYNAVGQQVGSFATNSANAVLNKKFTPGIYMVNIAAQGVQVTKKVVINQ